MFFVIRCWNNHVSLIEVNGFNEDFGKVVCRMSDAVFKEAQEEEYEYWRSKSYSEYRYLRTKPVLVGCYT